MTTKLTHNLLSHFRFMMTSQNVEVADTMVVLRWTCSERKLLYLLETKTVISSAKKTDFFPHDQNLSYDKIFTENSMKNEKNWIGIFFLGFRVEQLQRKTKLLSRETIVTMTTMISETMTDITWMMMTTP